MSGTWSQANCAAFCSNSSTVVTVTPLEKQKSSRGFHETLRVAPALPTTSGSTKKTTKKLGIVIIASTTRELVKPIESRAPPKKKPDPRTNVRPPLTIADFHMRPRSLLPAEFLEADRLTSGVTSRGSVLVPSLTSTLASPLKSCTTVAYAVAAAIERSGLCGWTSRAVPNDLWAWRIGINAAVAVACSASAAISVDLRPKMVITFPPTSAPAVPANW